MRKKLNKNINITKKDIDAEMIAENILNWLVSLIFNKQTVNHITPKINKIRQLPPAEASSMFYNLFIQLETIILASMPKVYTKEILRKKVAEKFSSNFEAKRYIDILQNEHWQIIKIQEELVQRIYKKIVRIIESYEIQKIIDEITSGTLLKGIVVEENRVSFEKAEQTFSKLPIEWLRLVINTFQNLTAELCNTLIDRKKIRKEDCESAKKEIYNLVGKIYGEDVVRAAASAKVESYVESIAKRNGHGDIITVTQEARDMLEDIGFRGLTTKGFIEDIETELIKKDSSALSVKVTASALKDENGNIQGMVVVAKDMTRVKELEEIKTEFVSTASHQLRTPITSIQWVIERFLKGEKNLSPKGREYLNDLHISTKRLSELVDALLNVSRIESSKGIDISPERLDAVSFIEKYIEEITPLQAKKNLKINFIRHPLKLVMFTDYKMFSNIIQSIVSNAVEYTQDNGTINITLKEKNGLVMIEVQDNGIGIPKDDQVKIFSKLYRAVNAKAMKTDGSGLGLYIAKRAVELLKGEIGFKSKVGIGTTFYVDLPLESKAQTGEKTLL